MKPGGSVKPCGDVGIRGLWQRQTDCIIDVRITDSDAKSYRNRTIANHLKAQEAEKKKKYHFLCQENRKNFSPFVATVDGVLGREAKMVLKQIARALATKWSCPHSQAQNYVNTMISVAIVRATHRCLRGSRVPSKFVNPDFLPFEDGAGLHLIN
mmetsp:Transcript_13619/g.19848  ORF Transcript_13619/g.19848 Transcript_13619/m.19848 type:complete len:155 (-) Transcript_13619:31-495(-)